MKKHLEQPDGMIKKIALTASILLFVLAQIFSFYVVWASHQEKMDLLKEKERKIFKKATRSFASDIAKAENESGAQSYVANYFFRKNMPEGCALYQAGKELCNTSPYDFDTKSAGLRDFESGNYVREENLGGKHLLLFYSEYQNRKEEEKYQCFYILDVTSVYSESIRLIVREMFFSFLASLSAAVLLVFFIKRITKPLQAVNETQRQLIGSMSHEMKTPLTAMRGYSETLLHVNLSEEQKEKALRYINSESARLSRLSEKMMELTKLYEPECRIFQEEVLLETLFHMAEEGVKHRLKEKKMTLLREGSLENRTKILDADLMTSFLINLINNGIMASEEGGVIYLGADESALWVRDEGCGIPREEIFNIRKAFYRVDKSRSRKSGNMGLGLALCEQIAAAHGKTMQIESKLGEGTKVWIEIP